KSWQKNNLMSQARLAIALETLQAPTAKIIMQSLKERAVTTEEMGMYWPENSGGWYWHQNIIETHTSIMEAFLRLDQNMKLIEEQKVWLLRQKQTQSWKGSRSTMEACYVLFLLKEDDIPAKSITVQVGSYKVPIAKEESGTSYYSTVLPLKLATPQNTSITVNSEKDHFSYGALYWQYEENNSKIEASGVGIVLKKTIFRKVQKNDQIEYVELKSGDSVNIGDRLLIRLSISCDRNMEYIHIKDPRAAGTEPADVVSTRRWSDNFSYCQVTRDVSTHIFIEQLNKGNFELSFDLTVQQSGNFDIGPSIAECMYAPEYRSNSIGMRLIVK